MGAVAEIRVVKINLSPFSGPLFSAAAIRAALFFDSCRA